MLFQLVRNFEQVVAPAGVAPGRNNKASLASTRWRVSRRRELVGNTVDTTLETRQAQERIASGSGKRSEQWIERITTPIDRAKSASEEPAGSKVQGS